VNNDDGKCNVVKNDGEKHNSESKDKHCNKSYEEK
jgi:hypothetical protein